MKELGDSRRNEIEVHVAYTKMRKLDVQVAKSKH